MGLSGPPAKMVEWEENQLDGISGGYASGEFNFEVKHADPAVTFHLIVELGKFLSKP